MEDDDNFSEGESDSDYEIREWDIGIAGDEQENEPWTPFLRGRHFDIEAYASNYRGRIKIIRLLSIADRCGGDERQAMQLEALRIAYDEAKKGEDVELFTKIVEKISGRLGPNYEMDEDWCRSVNQTRRLMERGLESWAQQHEEDYAENMISAEGVRTAYNYVGDFHYVHGAIRKALVSYWGSRRFCLTHSTKIEMLLRFLIVSIEMSHFPPLKSVPQGQIYQNPDVIAAGKLLCAKGLILLKTQRFRDAAGQLLKISRKLGNQFSIMMAPHDIATYGGLCALASFERTELKKLVMDNDNFQSYLDSAIEVRELISDFYSSRYSSCFEHLDNLREWLMLDIYFHDQFETLYDLIRKKAHVLYIRPFVSVELQTMANIFNTSIEALEKELKALINTNKIQAKIDSIDKVLYAHKEKENATFRRVLQKCRLIERDLKSMLLKAYFIRHHGYVDTATDHPPTR